MFNQQRALHYQFNGEGDTTFSTTVFLDSEVMREDNRAAFLHYLKYLEQEVLKEIDK